MLAARGGCWFRGGSWEVHLGVEADFRPARKAHPGVLVAGIDDLADHLRDADVTVELVQALTTGWPDEHTRT